MKERVAGKIMAHRAKYLSISSLGETSKNRHGQVAAAASLITGIEKGDVAAEHYSGWCAR